MQNSVQLRWIDEAEARQVREFALLHRAAAEPGISLAYSTPISARTAGFGCFRELFRKLARGGVWQRRLGAESDLNASWSRHLPIEPEVDRVLTTVLFTDIVDSSKRLAEMGDSRWRALLDRHDDAVRRQIAQFHGQEIKNLGDGFMAIFPGPTHAVRCAAAIVETTAPLGLAVRSGIHSGEIVRSRAVVGGIAVHIAARITAIADPGLPLVSSTVRDLVAGSGLVFKERGRHVLRGLPEEFCLYSVSSVDDSEVG